MTPPPDSGSLSSQCHLLLTVSPPPHSDSSSSQWLLPPYSDSPPSQWLPLLTVASLYLPLSLLISSWCLPQPSQWFSVAPKAQMACPLFLTSSFFLCSPHSLLFSPVDLATPWPCQAYSSFRALLLPLPSTVFPDIVVTSHLASFKTFSNATCLWGLHHM